MPPGVSRICLGSVVNLSLTHITGEVVVGPKRSLRQDIGELLCDAAHQRWLPPGAASKLFGRAGFLASNSMGRLGRIGQSVLKRQQAAKTARLDEETAAQLLYYAEVVQGVSPRAIPVVGRPADPLVLYTDAEYEQRIKETSVRPRIAESPSIPGPEEALC